MTELLHQRVRALRQRLTIRAWEYRQRNTSKGTWFRIRRVLVDAAQVYAIDDRDAEVLSSEGYVPAAAFLEIQPPKRAFLIPAAWLDRLPSRCRLPVRLSAALLTAKNLALVSHGKDLPHQP
jgi:hypothetical protein